LDYFEVGLENGDEGVELFVVPLNVCDFFLGDFFRRYFLRCQIFQELGDRNSGRGRRRTLCILFLPK